ncbi:hypothetical protein V2J09_016738 [Rumex salicifolius]
MALFAHGVISHTHNFTPLTNFPTSFSNPIHKFPSHPQSRNFKQVFISASSPSSSTSVAKSIPPVELQDATDSSSVSPNSSWSEFASKVSGEWDGYGADFTTEGKPIELPERVVPEAFREWEVKVFDWQTQCPTLADEQNFVLSYRSVKLLPTVGCEADAATVHSSDQRILGGEENKGLGAAFHCSGSYVSVWPLEEKEKYKLVEVEHCLVDPSNCESRVRVIQIIRVDDTGFSLKGVKVFSELWYGPFRNGDQLGGCSIRESGFASTEPLQASKVTGVWQSHEAVSVFKDLHENVFQELTEGSSREIHRDDCNLITLPRKLWCSLNKRENGESCAEVGWLLDSGSAISSRCVFSNLSWDVTLPLQVSNLTLLLKDIYINICPRFI